jgi:hypothetical protein
MKDIFIITSVINTGTEKWSYTNIRSVYSPQERFKQTLKTIESIRNLNDDSLILLIECSDISNIYDSKESIGNNKMETIFKEKTDIYINCFDNQEAKKSCLNTHKKGYGEVVKSFIAVDYILKNNIDFNRIFKISGRYELNYSFDKNNYSNDKYTFKTSNDNDYSFHTVLYSVPHNLLINYLYILKECIKIYEYQVVGLETLLPPMCNPKQTIKTIGVSGYCAVDGSTYFS